MRRLFGKALRRVLAPQYQVVHVDDANRRSAAMRAIGRVALQRHLEDRKTRVHAVIFSFDRALQLDALLRSMRKHFDRAPETTVLYRCSDARHRQSYDVLQKEHKRKGLSFVPDTDFRSDLLTLLERLKGARVFFLVDDIVFTEPVRLSQLTSFPAHSHILSLRLGENIKRSYMLRRPEQPPDLQPLAAARSKLYEWKWRSGDVDWGYAFSVDGHVFLASELYELASAMSFAAPNSFESQMQVYAGYFGERGGLCYPTSRLVNIPANRVQSEEENQFGDLHQLDMLGLYESGQRIAFEKFSGRAYNACHAELPMEFVSRS